MLKGVLGVKEENIPLGRRDKWTKEAYLQLEEAKRKERPSTFQKAGNGVVEQNECNYPYTKK